MTNGITATAMMARHAPSPSSSSPAARRSAASGLERSVRPSKLIHHAADALFLMPGDKFTLHRNP